MSTPPQSPGTSTTPPETVRATAAGLRAWICSGACQSDSGAFVAWVDRDTGRRSYEYPEITGYALTYLAGLPSLSEGAQTTGRRAADWLVARLQANNLAARDGWDNNAVYLFDLGMIATGLMAFGRRTASERYLDAGIGLTRLISEAAAAPALVAAVWRHGPGSERAGWSTRGIAHLAKLVQALLLVEQLGYPLDPGVAARLIGAIKNRQGNDGRIQTDDDDRATVMLHPHLYAAEGLWIWGIAREDPDAVQCAGAALQWVLAHQLGRGGFPRAVTDGDGTVSIEQADVTAQALRLAHLLGAQSPEIDRALARLVETTRADSTGLAVVYQPDKPPVHLNAWATIFAAQALALQTAARSISWDQLV
jgi:hypothetical protein